VLAAHTAPYLLLLCGHDDLDNRQDGLPLVQLRTAGGQQVLQHLPLPRYLSQVL
jgi:hypothetical protein